MIHILGGDWPFFWSQSLQEYCHIPSGWDASLNTGFGIPNLINLPINTYFTLSSCISLLGLSWNLVGLLLWLLPAVIISFSSIWYTARKLLGLPHLFCLVSSIIYTTNTYILLIITGGQLGFTLGYSIFPLFILHTIQVTKSLNIKQTVLTGLFWALTLFFDIRLFYIGIGITIFYGIYAMIMTRRTLFWLHYLYALIVCLMLHAFWILPLVISRSIVLPNGYTGQNNLSFFSFADFSHAFSLLHPNWPENIFGKVHFLQSEFLVLPLLAYGFLLFSQKKKPLMTTSSFQSLLFLGLLGLLGVLLSKGVQNPFGGTYYFLYTYLPGFTMFRDPTKFYIIIALCYSLLTPTTLYFAVEKTKKFISKQIITPLIVSIFIVFWLIIIRQLFTDKLTGVKHIIPEDYTKLAVLLSQDNTFFRTLWIPDFQRYGYRSDTHPAIGRQEVLTGSPSQQIKQLQSPNTQSLLQDLGVKYVIVPDDPEGEIFVRDHRYDDKQYQDTIRKLQHISWLKQIPGFSHMGVFELSNILPHFYIANAGNTTITSITNSHPTQYNLHINNAQKGTTLVFSEGYNKDWSFHMNNLSVQSKPYKKFLNSFILPENGNYNVTISYYPQTLVNVGFIISIVTFCIVSGFLAYIKLHHE